MGFGFRIGYGYPWIIYSGKIRVWILTGIDHRVSMGKLFESGQVWVYPIHILSMAIPSFEHFGIVRLTKYNSSLVYLFNYNYFNLAFLSFLKKIKKSLAFFPSDSPYWIE